MGKYSQATGTEDKLEMHTLSEFPAAVQQCVKAVIGKNGYNTKGKPRTGFLGENSVTCETNGGGELTCEANTIGWERLLVPEWKTSVQMWRKSTKELNAAVLEGKSAEVVKSLLDTATGGCSQEVQQMTDTVYGWT